MNASRWNGLSSICVEYPPGDKIGHILAYLSLTPFVIIVSFVTLALHNRDLPTMIFFAGQLINESMNILLKQTIRQLRPDSPHHFVRTHSKFGMPSQHSQFMAFFTTFSCLYLMLKAPNKRKFYRFSLSIFLVITLISVIFSRVYLLYHTWFQVTVGLFLGIFFGTIWYLIVYNLVEPYNKKISNLFIVKLLRLQTYEQIKPSKKDKKR